MQDDHSIETPCAPDAELAIINLMIDFPKTCGKEVMESGATPDLFHNKGNSEIFGLVLKRLQRGKPVDPSSLKEDIRAERPPNATLGRLAEILNHECDTSALAGYLTAIRQTKSKRILIEAAMQTPAVDGQDAISIIRYAMEAAQSTLGGSHEVYDAKRAAAAFIDGLKERQEADGTPGQCTGISPIDIHTGGMRKGELWVVGAKTSGGKSVLMLQMAKAAIQQGKRVAIFSLELSVEDVMGRIISNHAGISMGEITGTKPMTSAALKKLIEAVKQISETQITICDMAGMTYDQIHGHCVRMSHHKPLDLVIIDYLQMITINRIKGQNREQEVATISRSCKQLAKMLKCPVITATQLNAEGQSRESRAIEHDADNVLIIGDNPQQHGTSYVEFWKCRNGQRGAEFRAELDGEFQRFNFLP